MFNFNENQYNAYKVIYRLYPCIFVVRDEYYYIGLGVFQKCNADEITDYEEFRACLAEIKADSITEPKKSNVRKLKDIFDKIMYRQNILCKKVEGSEENKALQEFIAQLSDDEAESILQQMEDIRFAYNCTVGAFYRNT